MNRKMFRWVAIFIVLATLMSSVFTGTAFGHEPVEDPEPTSVVLKAMAKDNGKARFDDTEPAVPQAPNWICLRINVVQISTWVFDVSVTSGGADLWRIGYVDGGGITPPQHSSTFNGWVAPGPGSYQVQPSDNGIDWGYFSGCVFEVSQPTPTLTATLLPTATPTATQPPTNTPTPTVTQPPTNTPTATWTPTNTASPQPSGTPTSTVTVTLTAPPPATTEAPTASPTASPTRTPTVIVPPQPQCTNFEGVWVEAENRVYLRGVGTPGVSFKIWRVVGEEPASATTLIATGTTDGNGRFHGEDSAPIHGERNQYYAEVGGNRNGCSWSVEIPGDVTPTPPPTDVPPTPRTPREICKYAVAEGLGPYDRVTVAGTPDKLVTLFRFLKDGSQVKVLPAEIIRIENRDDGQMKTNGRGLLVVLVVHTKETVGYHAFVGGRSSNACKTDIGLPGPGGQRNVETEGEQVIGWIEINGVHANIVRTESLISPFGWEIAVSWGNVIEVHYNDINNVPRIGKQLPNLKPGEHVTIYLIGVGFKQYVVTESKPVIKSAQSYGEILSNEAPLVIFTCWGKWVEGSFNQYWIVKLDPKN